MWSNPIWRGCLARAGSKCSRATRREIEVVLDPAKLTAANLTVTDVAEALRAQNLVRPVGRFEESSQQHLALASGLWKSPDDIAAAPVIVKGGATIRVSDLGTVVPGSPDRTLLVTGNGRDAVSISISQQIGANILAVKDGVDAALASLAHAMPAGIRITKVYDLAEFVSASITNVRDAILIGGLLAIVVLLAFLRDLRLTLIAAVTLPLAIVPTFAFMQMFGGSINLMSMGGLAIAIGLVIDDAVVVVENIHRQASRGADAVAEAVSQLMAPLDELHAHDGRRVRAARAAVGRRGTVLSRALAQPVGGGAGVPRALGKHRPAVGPVGGAATPGRGHRGRTRRPRTRRTRAGFA